MRELDIDTKKINEIRKRGKLTVEDDIGFNYIVEILRLFNVNVKMWMKGSYVLNDKEGIMFTKADANFWADENRGDYFYEVVKDSKGPIARVNEFWGNKQIYIFRKEDKEYKFIGVFRQNPNKLDELFDIGIVNKRPYEKIGEEVKLR